MRYDCILDGDLLPKAWVKKGMIYLLIRRILKFTLLFFYCDVGFKFEDASVEDTKEKVANFLTLSAGDRSFNLEHSSLQEGFSTTALMAKGNDC